MQDLNDKVTGNTLSATEWNQLPSEIQNVIEALGQVLSNGDLNQLGKSIAGYAANGSFYTDSGAANAYVLAQVGSKQAPHAYTDGMEINFIPGNANSGASTVVVGDLGVKDLRDAAGGVLTANTLTTSLPVSFRYSVAGGHYRVSSTEPVTRTAPMTVTHDMASDANYTLTTAQEMFGRVVITDTAPPVLTTSRNIIVSGVPRGYFFVNSTLQSLTFKTAAGTGVAIEAGGGALLICDGTNVVSVDPTAPTAGRVSESVRQTVLTGGVDANGQANFLNAGTGLAVDMDAAASPVVATFAAGEDDQGGIDYRTRFSADQANYWSGLPANNVSYLMLDRDTGTGAVTAYKTLVPPQYGVAFDKTKQSLLPFSGVDTSTTITDTHGNAWTAGGNAQIDTAVLIDGQQTLLLDGTTDYIQSTAFTTLGSDSWTWEGKYNPAVLPTAGTGQILLQCYSAAGYGVILRLYNSAGNYILEVSLSSNGSSNDITAATTYAITTPVVGTAYHWYITYDSVAGKYFFGWGGISAGSVTSAARISAITTIRHGQNDGAGSNLNGSSAGLRFSPCCRYPNGTTFTPPTLPFAADAEWFDLSTFTYKYGSPTSWTAKQRVAVGEVTTGAAAPLSVTTYALRGAYESALATVPAVGTKTSFSHNLGVAPQSEPVCYGVNQIANSGYMLGMRVRVGQGGAAGYSMTGVSVSETRNVASFTTGSTAAIVGTDPSSGTHVTFTSASWKLQMVIRRGW